MKTLFVVCTVLSYYFAGAEWGTTINYRIKYFGSNYEKDIRNALLEVSSKTCLKFRESDDWGSRLEFIKSHKCASHTGQQPNDRPNIIWLTNLCHSKRDILKHIMKSLGFDYEVRRTDRDNYVSVFKNHTYPNKEWYFQKAKNVTKNEKATAYDYMSVLHYEAYEYSKNSRSPTVIAADPSYQDKMGTSEMLSDLDVQKIQNTICKSDKDEEVALIKKIDI